MIEGDRIIIQILKEIGIDVEEVDNLSEFSTEQVIQSVIQCLQKIDSKSASISSEVSNSVIIRYKQCRDIVKQLKKLGYNEDFSEDIFIYKNIQKIRDVYTFLISKLPKRLPAIPTLPAESAYRVANLSKLIKSQLHQPFFPFYKFNEKYKLNQSYYILVYIKQTHTLKHQLDDINSIPSSMAQTNNSPSLLTSLLDWNSSRIYQESSNISKTINYRESMQVFYQDFHTDMERSRIKTTSYFESLDSNIYDTEEDPEVISLKTQIKTARARIDKLMNKYKLLHSKIIQKRTDNQKISNTLQSFEQEKQNLRKTVEKLTIVQSSVVDDHKIKQLSENISNIQVKIQQDREIFESAKVDLEAKLGVVDGDSMKYNDMMEQLSSKISSYEEKILEISKSEHSYRLQILQIKLALEGRMTRSYLSEHILGLTQNLQSQSHSVDKVKSDIRNLYVEANENCRLLQKAYEDCYSVISTEVDVDSYCRMVYFSLADIIKAYEDIIECIKNRHTLTKLIKKSELFIDQVEQEDLNTNLAKLKEDLAQISASIYL